MYDKLGLKPPDQTALKKGKTASLSITKEILTMLSRHHIFPALVLEKKRLARILSCHLANLNTYCSAHPAAGMMQRLHCQHQQLTSTGRIGCHSPNLQSIPHAQTLSSTWLQTLVESPTIEHSTSGGKSVRETILAFDNTVSIRDCFIAQEGWQIVSVDFCHTELRIMAHISGDDALKQILQDPRDAFMLMASAQLGIELDQVTPEQRDLAKRVCYGLMYGIGATSLAAQLGLEVVEAQRLIDSFYSTYPELEACMEEMVKKLRDTGYVETIRGRQRSIPSIHSPDSSIRAAASRQAVNTVCQGSAADILKEALVLILSQILGKPARIILQVHDEVLLEVRDDHVEPICALVSEAVASVAKLDIPLPVRVSIGPTWGSLRPHAGAGTHISTMNQ